MISSPTIVLRWVYTDTFSTATGKGVCQFDECSEEGSMDGFGETFAGEELDEFSHVLLHVFIRLFCNDRMRRHGFPHDPKD